MELRIGAAATGPNFYQRPALIHRLRRALDRGNVAFVGPRRTGKTSCLEEIHRDPGVYVAILLNLEAHDTVEAWLTEMVTALRQELEQPPSRARSARRWAATALERVKAIKLPGGAGFELDGKRSESAWRQPADEFLKLLSEAEIPILFLLDEFPTFLSLVAKKRSRDEVEAVLNWFRAARGKLKDTQVRFLVTGSIGLKGLVRRLGLSPTVNEFDTHEIPPMTEEEALGLLERLAADNGVLLDAAGRKHILELLGANWPILLQLFVSELQDAGLPVAPSPAELERIYRERLVHGSRNAYCDGMYDRLAETFAPGDCQLAREILKATCRAPEGLGRARFEEIHRQVVPDAAHRDLLGDQLDHVLDTLRHDGYLLQETDGEQRTRLASNILRDFWRRKTS